MTLRKAIENELALLETDAADAQRAADDSSPHVAQYHQGRADELEKRFKRLAVILRVQADRPRGHKATEALESFADNAPAPWRLFRAVIDGDNYDEAVDFNAFGYLEIGMLADALREYADAPDLVRGYLEGADE